MSICIYRKGWLLNILVFFYIIKVLKSQVLSCTDRVETSRRNLLKSCIKMVKKVSEVLGWWKSS